MQAWWRTALACLMLLAVVAACGPIESEPAVESPPPTARAVAEQVPSPAPSPEATGAVPPQPTPTEAVRATTATPTATRVAPARSPIPIPCAHASPVAHPDARTVSHGHAITGSGDAHCRPDGNSSDPNPRAFACTGHAHGHSLADPNHAHCHAIAHANRTYRHTDGDAGNSDGRAVIRSNGNRPKPAARTPHTR